MSRVETTTNFRDSNGADLGKKLITKDYLISVYPSIGQQIGIPPELWVWGNNGYGQAGTNDTSYKSTPVTTLSGGSNWKSVAGGITNSVAIKNDGTLWVWGGNRFGESGTNLAPSGAVPVYLTPVTTFAGGTNWKQVNSNSFDCAAIKTDGTLWTWGSNYFGVGGIGGGGHQITPVQVFGSHTNWKQVSIGRFYNISAVKTDGTLWTWGRNSYGGLGTNDTTDRLTPVTTFAGGTNWKQVSAGTHNFAAIKTDGTLWTWGRNANGQLGINDTTNRLTPVQVFGNHTNWKQVSAGYIHCAAIKTDGTLWVWGNNSFSALGTNDSTQRDTPVTTFAGGTNWKQVSAGTFYCSAIKTDGTLWTWGRNADGNLGVNDTTGRATPVTTLAGGTNWKQVSGQNAATIAIKTSDDLIGI
jgi:alpha-tubulin suppressor-like RCC1 family protein